MNRINIAIDGPAGAGKSTAAKGVAEALGIHYLDTGAMYRAMALYAKRNGVDARDTAALDRILPGADISVRYADDGAQRVLLADEDVTDLLRTQDLSMAASTVSMYPPVRDKLAALQRAVGEQYDVVMDGRDITTNVLPYTKYKFFITASPEERAKRRLSELAAKGDAGATFTAVLEDIRRRDHQDETRAYMPLTRTPDAYYLDTTGMTIGETVAQMLAVIREKGAL